MTFAEYRAINAVNVSSLLQIGRSPQHYMHAMDSGDADTPALAFGRLAHVAVLEPERFEAEIAVWKGPVRRGKAYDAWAVEAAGKLQVSEKEHLQCLAMQVAIREHPVAGPYLRNGQAEVTLEWKHRSGIACKSRLDWVNLDDDVIVDLKTTINAGERDFGIAAAKYRYHTRAAFYADAYRTRFGKVPTFVLVAVEKEAPYAVAVYQVGEQAIDAGRTEYERLLMKLKLCRDTGRWPGIMDDRLGELQLPSWVFGDDDLVWAPDEAEAAHG